MGPSAQPTFFRHKVAFWRPKREAIKDDGWPAVNDRGLVVMRAIVGKREGEERIRERREERAGLFFAGVSKTHNTSATFNSQSPEASSKDKGFWNVPD